jgi:2-C-methyl-D-erythritol 4-phosphate cytidylyltransferase / 2-C-methyl-D-erythritol 2,4-cyclodiphosphate synthase
MNDDPMDRGQPADTDPLFVVIPAGGSGSRFGAPRPKQYMEIDGRSILWHTTQAVLRCAPRACMVVVAPKDEWVNASGVAQDALVSIVRQGGATRCASVLAGLNALVDRGLAQPDDWVLVHDAARPGLSAQALERLIAACTQHPVGGILALRASDTVRMQVEGTWQLLPRDEVWLAQTPQMFRIGPLREALLDMPEATDECGAMEVWARRHGLPAPLMVQGERGNFKLTTAPDLELMQAQWQTRQKGESVMTTIRVGQGYDVHALVPGRRLILGGVLIDHPTGLLGHSDADVLLHAITDALLGAAGLGDIGRQFPDTDPAHRNADSRALLRQTVARVHAAGFVVGNVDASVIAQAPRLAAYIETMQVNIAQDLSCAADCVNIKAKTSERLGFVGRQEGIEAHANVLLVRRADARG